MITFACSRCRQVMSVDDGAAGKLARCAGCGATLAVPPPRRRAPALVRRPQPLVPDAGVPPYADQGRGPHLPIPAPEEEESSSALTASDTEWEGQAAQRKTRTLLIAGGAVAGIVVVLLLILVLASGGPSQRPGPAGGKQADLAHRNDPPDLGEGLPPPPHRYPGDFPGERPDTSRAAPGPGAGSKPDSRPDDPPQGNEKGGDPKPSSEIPPPASGGSGETKPPATGEPPPPVRATEPDKPAVDDKEVDRLVKELRDPKKRLAALAALGKLGEKVKDRAGKHVVQCLVDNINKPDIAFPALDALEKIDPPVGRECTPIIRDDKLKLQSIQRLRALGKDAKSAAPLLIHVTETVIRSRGSGLTVKEPFKVAAAAVEALVVIAPGDKDLHACLLRWGENANHDIRLAVVRALPELEQLDGKAKAAAVTALTRQLQQAEAPAPLRAAAAEALGSFGPDAKAAVKALDAARRLDKDSDIRDRVIPEALKKIRGEP